MKYLLFPEEENVEEKGVYKVTKTADSITGTIMVNLADCPKPADGCRYMVTLTDSYGELVSSHFLLSL